MKKLLSLLLAAVMVTSTISFVGTDGAVYADDEITLTYGTDVPAFTTTAIQYSADPYDCGQGHGQILFDTSADSYINAEIDSYRNTLAGNGFSIRGSESNIGLDADGDPAGNRFFTYYKENAGGGYTVVHCNYFAALDQFRIIYGVESYLGASAPVTGYTAVKEPSMSIIGMSDSLECLVVQLADGSFIIIDGGKAWNEERTVSYTDDNGNTRTMDYYLDYRADMEALYDFLDTNKPQGESKPQITWMITHVDGDHICLPYKFMESSFGRLVDVNTVIYNFPGSSVLNSLADANSGMYVSSFMNAFSAADHFIYHTGEKLYLPGCEIEFLMTHEDYWPNPVPTGNHASGAWRFNFTDSGKTAYMLGDCETGLNDQMAEVFGSYLDSDILQPAHHGSNGGTVKLYSLLHPSVIFWTCGDFPFYYDNRHTGTNPKYAFNAILRNMEGVTHFTNSATHTLDIATLTEVQSGGSLVHQGAYSGRKGNARTYLSDLYGTEQMKFAFGSDETAPFSADSSFLGDGSQIYPIYLWNRTHTVNVVHPTTHPNGRSIATLAEGSTTFYADDIVLGYQGKRFEKGLGGHLTDDKVFTNRVVFDIRGAAGERFYAIAGLTGDAANRPSTQTSAQSYGVTFKVYGSKADNYSDSISYTLLSSVDGVGGYGSDLNSSKTYNTAEFDIDVSGWNFIKLEAVSDGSGAGGSYAWGDACLYSKKTSQSTISRPENLEGKNEYAEDIVYLSDLYSTEAKKDSFVIGASNNTAAPRAYAADTNFERKVYVYKGTGTATGNRTEVSANTTLNITGADGSISAVPYSPSDIAIGYRGTKFEKGLGGIASPGHCKPASVIYDLSGLGAERFYAVGGITGSGNANDATNNNRKLSFNVYGSKTGMNASDFELVSYTSNVYAYLLAEFDLDISQYRYLKLEVECDNTTNSGKSFAWADACVYRVGTPQEPEHLTNIGTSGGFGGHPDAVNVTYLSDVYDTNMVDSFVIGVGGNEAAPREFKKDTNWDNMLLVWSGTANGRWQITAANSPRTISVRNENGTTSSVVYTNDEIALGYRGTEFEKGLGGLVSPSTNKSAYIVYDVRDLDAKYFYSAVGLTGNANANNTGTYPYKVTFTLYGSKNRDYNENSVFIPLAYASDIRAYFGAEFNVDISGYNYLKLEAVSDGGNSGGSFAWGGACVYDTNAVMDRVSMTAGSDLTLHIHAKMSEGTTAPGARFSGIGDSVTISGVKDGERWRFDYPGVYSQYMNEDITVELLDDDSSVIETKTFCTAAYCDSIHELGQTAEGLAALGLSAAKFAKLETLLADMLEYGAAAQNYAAYKTDSLPNGAAWVASAKTKSFTAPQSAASSSVRGRKDYIRSAALYLSKDISFIINVSASQATKLVVTAYGGTAKEYPLSSAKRNGSVYVVLGEGLPATDFDTVYTFALTDGKTVYHTVTYSVNSYVASKHGSDDALLAAVVKALYNYGVSADNYND